MRKTRVLTVIGILSDVLVYLLHVLGLAPDWLFQRFDLAGINFAIFYEICQEV